jgi:ATPase family associated with various cellular activities (AAA)
MSVITIKKTKTQQKLSLYSYRISDVIRNLMFEFSSKRKQGIITMDNAEFPIEIVNIIENSELSNSVRIDTVKNTYLLIKALEKDILVNFKSYWYNDQYLYHEVSITSEDEFSFTDYSFYEYLLDNSIYHSEFKGAYINIDGDDFQNFYQHELPERSFDDIFLPDRVIKELKAFVSVFEKRQRILRYLFVGLPGSGKTESLIVLSNLLKAKGVTILKVSASAIRNAVKFANILAPSLIILDDIDLELGNRDDYSQTSYLRAFLDILDGVEKLNPQVGIIATTNSIWLVDTAAQRPGRFNKILTFGELTKDNIGNIVKKSLKNLAMEHLSMLYANEIVDNYHSGRRTGAYIYNMTQMLASQIDIGMIHENINDILDYIHEDSNTTSGIGTNDNNIGFKM